MKSLQKILPLVLLALVYATTAFADKTVFYKQVGKYLDGKKLELKDPEEGYLTFTDDLKKCYGSDAHGNKNNYDERLVVGDYTLDSIRGDILVYKSTEESYWGFKYLYIKKDLSRINRPSEMDRDFTYVYERRNASTTPVPFY